MAGYIVRDIETKALIGVFSAANVEGLYWLIDEVQDPSFCECMLMKNGEGLFINMPAYKEDNIEDHENIPSTLYLQTGEIVTVEASERMLNAVVERKWKKIETPN